MPTIGTVLPEEETLRQFVSDGTTTQYPYNFTIQQAGDLGVWANAPDAVINPTQQRLVLNTDYSVTGVGTIGGGTFILLNGAFDAGWIITVDRDMQFSIETEYADARNINGANLDTDFERVVLQTQQLNSFTQQRCISFKINSYLPNVGQTQIDYPAEGEIFIGGANNTIVTVPLVQGEDVSTLRGELALETPSAPGTALVGYYDIIAESGLTTQEFLNKIQGQTLSVSGANSIGFFNPVTEEASTVGEQLNSSLVGQSYLTDTSLTPNTIVCDLNSYDSYSKGDSFTIYPNNTITGPTTININSVGAVALIRDLGPLIANEVLADQPYRITFNGTAFVVENPTPAFYGSSVYLSGTQVIPINTETQILFDAAEYDPNGIYDLTTHTFIPQRQGSYLLSFCFPGLSNSNSNGMFSNLYKNAALYKQMSSIGQNGSGVQTMSPSGPGVFIRFNGSTDSAYLTFLTAVVSYPLSGISSTWCNLSYVGR